MSLSFVQLVYASLKPSLLQNLSKEKFFQNRHPLGKLFQKFNLKTNIQIKMENLVKEEIKEETMDIGTEFLSASSCNDEDTISR
jgi:hypothetical protein